MYRGIRTVSLILAFLTTFTGDVAAQPPMGVFASVDGKVELQRGDLGAQRPTVGAPLLVKDQVQVGDTGRVRVLLNDESLIDLGSTSQFVFTADGGAPAKGERMSVKLDQGVMRANVSQPDQKSPGFEIETPTALVRTRDANLIVRYRAEDRSSEVFCVRGQAQVQGTLGVIGKSVELVAGRATRVQSGAFPSASVDIDAARIATYERDLEILGTGSDDHLDTGNPLVTGHLMAPGDRPDLPSIAQAAGEEPYIRMIFPGETLVEQLSPDLRTNTQPIPEYELAAPGVQPPPVNGD
jgi:hypothetical protein